MQTALHSSLYSVRPAVRDDIAAIKTVLLRSVREVCQLDHANNETIISNWCANKTEENLDAWISSADTCFVVAESEHGKIVGVASCRMQSSTIDLCYLIPEALHQGVGTLMLKVLEKKIAESGAREIKLESTKTSLNFYEKHGFALSGEPSAYAGVTSYPLRKVLR